MNRWVRIGAALTLGVGFGLLPGAQAALAAPTTACTVNDIRLPNITGLVATDEGYAAITNPDDSVQQVRIFLLDTKCQVTGTLTSDVDPRDTEDLAHTSDGTYWVADIGDSDTAPNRETVAVHEFPQQGAKTIQRMKYPDGPKDAQALLVQNNNVPVIVTKSTSGTANVYKASQAITGPSKDAANAVPLTLVGKVTLGSGQAVTGAALAPDGKRAALRTSNAVYEWNVTGGDIANSLVKGEPRKTQLTGTDGGAVAYSANGKNFLTTPTGSANNPAAAIQSWPIAATSTGGQSTSTPDATADAGGGLLSGINFGQLTTLVGVVGVIGVGLLAAGIVGIVRFRRRSEGASPVSGISGRAPAGLGPQGRPGGPEQVGETMQFPRVGGSSSGGGRPPERARGGAAVVPPSPRSSGRDGRGGGPVGAGVGPVGWSASGRSESEFRAEGGSAGGSGNGPARGGATVYGSGRSGSDPETTGSGRARPPQGRVPGDGPRRSGPGDPETTGGGRVRRSAGSPRELDPPRSSGRDSGSRDSGSRASGGRDSGGRDSGGWDRGGPPPVERAAPTRQRRPAPPPGTTYGRESESRGGSRDRDDWDAPRSGSSGRARPPTGERERMRPPPPPGGERGRRDPRRDGDGRPPAPPGRRPPAPPEWSRGDD